MCYICANTLPHFKSASSNPMQKKKKSSNSVYISNNKRFIDSSNIRRFNGFWGQSFDPFPKGWFLYRKYASTHIHRAPHIWIFVISYFQWDHILNHISYAWTGTGCIRQLACPYINDFGGMRWVRMCVCSLRSIDDTDAFIGTSMYVCVCICKHTCVHHMPSNQWTCIKKALLFNYINVCFRCRFVLVYFFEMNQIVIHTTYISHFELLNWWGAYSFSL